ncbi:MAG: hypothetical protein AMS23_01530 [Bacteroides sp. SM1_62]|nr:MAG: hypothetical protein AMS26_11285 [Bacteroides sp. SM23_62]KPL26499.1 MAG: hypothetical protein AMS23_01530 [Bacteroides sp. SM1_62]
MKNTKLKLILLVLLSFGVLFFANGQKRAMKKRANLLIETTDIMKVKGTVTAFHNYYLRNAEITVRKTGSKALTDSLGRFEIMAFSGDVPVFMANGFEKNRRKVASADDEISVNMILAPGKKNKKIAVDYGHMYERDLAYAIEHYSDFNNDFMKYSDMKELLQKELVGVQVVDMGEIQVFIHGEEAEVRSEFYGPTVTYDVFDKDPHKRAGRERTHDSQPLGYRLPDSQSIRQVYEQGGDIISGELSENNGAAIFVLDGRIVPSIDLLSPGDVKAVKLLRNVGTARYGPQGANGVVLINTKHL